MRTSVYCAQTAVKTLKIYFFAWPFRQLGMQSASAGAYLEAGRLADGVHLRLHNVLRRLAGTQLLIVLRGPRHRRPAPTHATR